jgi:WD40 repeat protein
VARFDSLRIEGFCKSHHAGMLQAGQRALVEAEIQGAQVTQLVGHTAAVNQLAIAQDGSFLASAGDDGTVLIWSWPGAARVATLPHPGAVHALDLRLAADNHYLLVTAGEDRIVRVWRLSPTGQVRGPAELQGHDGVIRSLALSPDGALCASGGEDRKIGLWDIAQEKHVGWVAAVGAYKKSSHQGTVTGVQFAAADILVSTGSDNVHKVWKVRDGKSQLLKVHKGRTGDVAHLGYGQVGQHVLLDHGDELRLLDRDQGAVQAVLHNGKHVRFESFACFSPTNRLLLTTSSNGLQLWRTPLDPIARAARYKAFRSNPEDLPDLGGFEVRHYQLPKATQARCGVFAPDESVIFTAGTGRAIQVWAIPPATEWQPRQARLTYVGSEVEPGTDLVRIQAEMDNPPERGRWWLPGTFVNLKILQ